MECGEYRSLGTSIYLQAPLHNSIQSTMTTPTKSIITSVEFGQSSVKDLETWLSKWLKALEDDIEGLQHKVSRENPGHHNLTHREFANDLGNLLFKISTIHREMRKSTQNIHRHLNDLKLPLRIHDFCSQK